VSKKEVKRGQFGKVQRIKPEKRPNSKPVKMGSLIFSAPEKRRGPKKKKGKCYRTSQTSAHKSEKR